MKNSIVVLLCIFETSVNKVEFPPNILLKIFSQCIKTYSFRACDARDLTNHHIAVEVRKAVMIRNRYNPNKSQEVSPFPAGDHKTAMNRRESMKNTRHK